MVPPIDPHDRMYKVCIVGLGVPVGVPADCSDLRYRVLPDLQISPGKGKGVRSMSWMGMPTLISWISHPISSNGVDMVAMGESSYALIGRVEGTFFKKVGDI